MAHQQESEGKGNVELEEAIDLRSLVLSGEAVFSVKDSEENSSKDFEKPEDVFDREVLIENSNLKVLDLDDDLTGLPFETIKASMTKVDSSGNIFKKVLRAGGGEIVPRDAIVRIHYAGYFEYNEVPFDSTYLRGKAIEFVLGNSYLVPGLDLAVATMRSNEKAEFILQPCLAYGKYGCPPRIPPNAEVLFIIEVMRWSVGSEASVARAATNIEGEKGWERVKPAFKALNHEGTSLYHNQKFSESKNRLERAKRLLDNCHLKDETEEKDFEVCMYKVSVNLAMVLNKLHGHASFAPLAICNCKDALKLKPNCGKAQLQWGLALITLGELDRAKERLMLAKKQMPNSSDVTDALEKLEIKKRREKEVEGGMWKKVFSPEEKSTGNEETELSAEAQEILDLLKEFSTSPQRELVLPSTLTYKEMEVLKTVAENLKLEIQARDKSLCITKIK